MKVARLYSLLITLLLIVTTLVAQNAKVKTGPPKPWINPVDFNKKASPPSGQESSFYYLLLDEQENVPTQEDFIHYAYKILNNDGLQQMSDLSIEFDPAYEQLTVHSVFIHRGDKTISQLPAQIRTLQREQSMDRYLYDGTMTAVINLTDVRVGDIIEYAVTRKGYNPIYEGHINRTIKLNYSTPFEKSYKRITVPASLSPAFRYVNTETKPVEEKKDNTISYTWAMAKTKGIIADNHDPDWYNPYAYVQISNFKSWAEVATWAVKCFRISEKEKQMVAREIVPLLNSDSLNEYTLRAIRFVQDEIRYLGFESGANSHQPHPPSKVYQQRFGDCKDKSLLLATLLNVKGIESYPVLLNTTYRSKVKDQLPSANAFDHCIVQIKLGDRILYVDPTINNQGGTVEHYYFPAYEKGLVVSNTTADLTDFPESEAPSIQEVQTFDLSSIGGEAMLTIQTTYTASEAESQRSYFANDNIESIQKGYLNYYGNLYSDITVFDTVQFEDNREANIFITKEKYKIPTFWKPLEGQEGKIYCEFYAQALESYFNVTKSVRRSTPYRLTYPLNYTQEMRVNMPEAWPVDVADESMDTDYYSYKYSVTGEEEKSFLIKTQYQTKEASLPPDHFSQFIKDHEKMMANLNYKLSYDPSMAQASQSRWPGAILSVLSLAFATVLVFWLYTRYDPQPYYPAAWGQPIGGWLVLVCIGVSFTPLRIIYDFATEDYLLSGQTWLSLWYLGNYALAAFIFFEHIYNITFLVFSLLLVVLFFQRRSSVPVLMMIFYGASCVITIMDTLLLTQMGQAATVDYKDLFRAIFAAVVWIPYFKMSTRVKRTFVNTYREDGTEGGLQPVMAEQ